MIEINNVSAGNYNFFYFHDGNKNGSDLVFYQRANNVAVHYEYAPFGAVTATSSSTPVTAYDFTAINHYRFSSEFHDDTLGLVYYNYRHYNPKDGRWTSRNLIGESSGINIYAAVLNNPIYDFDIYGLKVSWAARDLSMSPLGNHHFIIFEYESKDAAPEAIRIHLQEIVCAKSHCKAFVATIGLNQNTRFIQGENSII